MNLTLNPYKTRLAAFLLILALPFSDAASQEALLSSADPSDMGKAKTSHETADYYLREARIKLSNAFDSYREGDKMSAQTNLEEATAFLNKAAENSSAEKTKKEARKLATEIDKFRDEISQVPARQESILARFWHRASSIIKREADHIIHGYMEISAADKTMKPLLDAKMHLFNAEHDLFVSHDIEEAYDELGKVIVYLGEAADIATPAAKGRIDLLRENIQSLKEKITVSSDIWKKDSVINSLNVALSSLAEAYMDATPTTKMRIEQIQNEMQALHTDVRRSSIRDDYDTSMATLRTIINDL
jgi:hypothetical protein